MPPCSYPAHTQLLHKQGVTSTTFCPASLTVSCWELSPLAMQNQFSDALIILIWLRFRRLCAEASPENWGLRKLSLALHVALTIV